MFLFYKINLDHLLKRQLMVAMFMLLGCLSIHAADDDLITEQIVIKLEKAGTLPDKISDSDKYRITNLKIIGDINGTDFRLLRDMAGSDYAKRPTAGKLSVLDLKDAKIVSGGDYYLEDTDNKKYKTVYINILEALTFSNCSSLTTLDTPSSIYSIGEAAFKDCSSLTSINIHLGVTEILPSAFYGCSKLISVTIPSMVTYIGGGAFRDCKSLRGIYVNWEKPLDISKDYSFDGVDKTSCTLYVPQGTLQDYKSAPVWGEFENIVEYDATAINNICTAKDVNEVARYGADGYLLDIPVKGLNIVKYSDGSMKKIMVK